MKHYKDTDGQVFAYDEGQVAGGLVPEQMIEMSEEEVFSHQNPPRSVPLQIDALHGLLAIDAADLSEKYTHWASSGRSFIELAFISKAMSWRRTDDAIASMTEGMGINAKDMDEIFFSAIDIRNREQADA